jgi:alpha-glucosidase
MLISDRIGDLFESDILTSLNEPCKIEDTSWIKPGKATWPWWNGTIVGDSTITPGNNFETNKYYIDFCARNGIEYHSVVEYGGHEWYQNNSTNGYAPGTVFDVTKPVDGLDMQKVCDYAKSMGVGIRVWVHWAALYPKLEEAFTIYEKWGIKGLMVDFMDRDDQEMVNIQNEILQRAANHHLHIQFHGAYKPTGLQRTYPNEFTREGTLNYEVDKWDKTVTPAHDLNIVFTRLLAGATDYHLGGFRAVPENKFEVHYSKPLVMGTRCHMLAMYVVLESYLGLVCDYPGAYEGQPGFEFIKKVPTVWDKTKVLDAKLSEYIIFAREKNKEWYIGSITNESRDETVSFSFLPEGTYSAEIYSDVPGSPNSVNREIRTVSGKSKVTLHLEQGGGMVMHVRKI